MLILQRLPIDQLFTVTQGDDAGNLDGLEYAIIVIALDGGQGAHHLGVAGAEAEPPTGHVVTLAHRGRLDADFLGARHTEKTRRSIAIEADIAISEVMDYHEAETPCQRDDFDEKVPLDHGCAGIVWIIQNKHLGPRIEVFGDRGDIGEKAIGMGAIEADDVAGGESDRINVDRKGRRWYNSGIAGTEQGEAHVAEHFLGPQPRQNFGIGVQLHSMTAGITKGHLTAEVV